MFALACIMLGFLVPILWTWRWYGTVVDLFACGRPADAVKLLGVCLMILGAFASGVIFMVAA